MSDSLAEALRRLPHGPEFRFLDRVLSLEPGKAGVGAYRVRADDSFLRGHFPGEPLLPGVLLIEAVAQLAGVVAQSDPAIPPLAGLKLTALRAAKILGSARPGDDVQLQAWITGRLGGLIQARGRASVDNRELLVTELTFSGTAPESKNTDRAEVAGATLLQAGEDCPLYMTYTPKPIDTSTVRLTPDVLELTERLAKNAHDVWARQRLADGWTYGPKRDDSEKKHPCLVAYEDLPESEKKYDRYTAMESIKAILALGFRISKSPH